MNQNFIFFFTHFIFSHLFFVLFHDDLAVGKSSLLFCWDSNPILRDHARRVPRALTTRHHRTNFRIKDLQEKENKKRFDCIYLKKLIRMDGKTNRDKLINNRIVPKTRPNNCFLFTLSAPFLILIKKIKNY